MSDLSDVTVKLIVLICFINLHYSQQKKLKYLHFRTTLRNPLFGTHSFSDNSNRYWKHMYKIKLPDCQQHTKFQQEIKYTQKSFDILTKTTIAHQNLLTQFGQFIQNMVTLLHQRITALQISQSDNIEQL